MLIVALHPLKESVEFDENVHVKEPLIEELCNKSKIFPHKD